MTLATTLTDLSRYCVDDLARLYGDRWQMEVDLRHLKTTMGMNVLHCQTAEGVMKELWMYMLVYNLVQQVILEVDRDHQEKIGRISFIDAVRWLCATQGGQMLIALIVNPLSHRSDRTASGQTTQEAVSSHDAAQIGPASRGWWIST